MKKPIFTGIPSGAYFVKEPKIVLNKPLSNQLDIEHIIDEPLDVVKRRLKYKIDRGEYDYLNVVYARKVWDHFRSVKKCVPAEIMERWHTQVLSNFLEKTKEQFVEKFQVESLLQDLSGEERVSYTKELYEYLYRDVKKRAASKPLFELPKFVLDEIEDIQLACGTIDT